MCRAVESFVRTVVIEERLAIDNPRADRIVSDSLGSVFPCWHIVATYAGTCRTCRFLSRALLERLYARSAVVARAQSRYDLTGLEAHESCVMCVRIARQRARIRARPSPCYISRA